MDINKIKSLGLSSNEADVLLTQYGLNEITTDKRNVFLKSFFSQFNNFLVLLLLFSAIISFVVGERMDSLFIFIIVLINAFFGLYQEYKAEKSISLLKKITFVKVRVVRDGIEQEIDSRYVTPGDILYLEEGSKIPADCQLIDSRHLEINEAILTGESFPVVKNAKDKDSNILYMGTVVSKGRAYAKVIATGLNTKFGIIASSLMSIKESKTPLQYKLEKFTKQISFVGILSAIIVFSLSFVQDKNLIQSFILAVSLLVASVPEGLPAVMTIILSIGVENMAKKNTIVRKLNAIETMGSLTLIATDKTGTLTTNEMRVKELFIKNKKYELEKWPTNTDDTFSKILLTSVLCSTSSLVAKEGTLGGFDVVGDTTEGSLLHMAISAGVDYKDSRKKWKIVDELPFNATTKRMSVYVQSNNAKYIFSKGAPESIIDICSHIQIGSKSLKLDERQYKKIKEEFEGFANRGLRLIAFSFKDNSFSKMENNQTFLGFVGIADPVRKEVFGAISDAKSAGIKVVMITGDNELTARSVGLETGIIDKGDQIMTGSILQNYSDQEILKILPNIKIFARTSPEDKYRLVKLYQQLGEIVAVTGDGVNDVLALKQANVGVAMGITGTDVAKDTAHIIITDDNFATLIKAIEEGRNIFSHIKNAIKYLLACNISEILYVIASLIFNLPILTALQLLYINVITDGLPAISLAFSPNTNTILLDHPNNKISILDKLDTKYIIVTGVTITTMVALLSYFGYSRTVLFSAFIFIQHILLIDLYLSHKNLFTNFKKLFKPIFLVAFLMPFLIHPFVLYIPSVSHVFDLDPIDAKTVIVVLTYSFLFIIGINLKRKIYDYKY